MTKRWTFGLAIAFCLVASQTAALLHSISHLALPAGKASQFAKVEATGSMGSGADEFCLACLAFSQVTTAAPATAAGQPMVLAAIRVAVLPALGRSVIPFFSFFARAPPVHP